MSQQQQDWEDLENSEDSEDSEDVEDSEQRKLVILRIPALPRPPTHPTPVSLEVARNSNGFYLVPENRRRILQKVEAYLCRQVSPNIKVTKVKSFNDIYWMIFLTFTIKKETIIPGSEECQLEYYTQTFNNRYHSKNGWIIQLCRPWIPTHLRERSQALPSIEEWSERRPHRRPHREENVDAHVQHGVQRLQLHEDENENNQLVIGVPIAEIVNL